MAPVRGDISGVVSDCNRISNPDGRDVRLDQFFQYLIISFKNRRHHPFILTLGAMGVIVMFVLAVLAAELSVFTPIPDLSAAFQTTMLILFDAIVHNLIFSRKFHKPLRQNQPQKSDFSFSYAKFFFFLRFSNNKKNLIDSKIFFTVSKNCRPGQQEKEKNNKKKKKNACRPAKSDETETFIIYFAGNLESAHNHREV